jgi:hypothetical protein
MAAMRAWWDKASTAVIKGKTQLALLLLDVSHTAMPLSHQNSRDQPGALCSHHGLFLHCILRGSFMQVANAVSNADSPSPSRGRPAVGITDQCRRGRR